MRKYFILAIVLLASAEPLLAKSLKLPKIAGMYLQWGYNRERYSTSDLHFANGDKYDFTVHNAKAVDQPNWSALHEKPLDITIPQNSFRIGFYLDEKHKHAIEINFDHAKYVVPDNQTLRVSGKIGGEAIDKDTTIDHYFLHFEHTNGANFYHINYVTNYELFTNKKNRPIITGHWKIGAGLVVPRSDVTLLGVRLDNVFHVAGYIASAEAGFRYYPFKKWFLELNGKSGFANYTNVLTVEEGHAHHHFTYVEAIALFGYDINFHNKKKVKLPQE